MERQPGNQLVSFGSAWRQIPALGVGTWAWGDRWLWGYGREFTDKDLREAFDVSLAAGVRFFDTAEVYGRGRSEVLLGSFIRATGAPVVVGTKFMPFPWRLHKKTLRHALQASLARLGLEVVDLYQMHWPFPPVSIETWMDALADAVAEGLVREVGVSNYAVGQMRRAHEALARCGIRLASNQVKFSLLDRQPLRMGLLDACSELGVTFIAYSPLAMGVLTGKYSAEAPPPGMRSRRYNRHLLKRIEPLLGLLGRIAAERGKTRAQVALNWVMAKGAMPIPGAKNARQAVENAGSLGWRLGSEEIQDLDQAWP